MRDSESTPQDRFGLCVCVLASGSKGNAIYVSDGETSVLVDAGLPGVEIGRRLDMRGLSPDRLDAVLVSHEHSDHLQGVGVMARRYRLPVHVSGRIGKTAEDRLGRVNETVRFECGAHFRIGTLQVHPFSLSHDAEDPAGFIFRKNSLKIGIATDLGIATALVKEHLKGCDLLILEANHDPAMLMEGPYPWHLKQRIRGRSGHLSNPDARMLTKELLHDRLRHVILAHLSETNNTPEKALSEVGLALSGCRTRLSVASQQAPGDLIFL
jgi:phosphoribosyl 1,2-cyclic phosphodiesterase